MTMTQKPIVELSKDSFKFAEGLSNEQLKKARDKSALKEHPDRHPNATPEEKAIRTANMQVINNEYELRVIANDESKASINSPAPARLATTTLFKTVKEEQTRENVSYRFNVKFSSDSTLDERGSALDGYINRFFINKKLNTSKEPTDLLAGTKKVGEVSFLGRFVELVKTVVTKEVPVTQTPDTLKIAASTAPTLRIGPARAA